MASKYTHFDTGIGMVQLYLVGDFIAKVNSFLPSRQSAVIISLRHVSAKRMASAEIITPPQHVLCIVYGHVMWAAKDKFSEI